MRSEFENAIFWVEFADYPMRYRVTVSGRNLHRIYTNILQARMEWILAIPPEREHEKDGVAVINHIAVKATEEKRG